MWRLVLLLALIVSWGAGGCGPGDRAWLALRVHAPDPAAPDGVRRFPPFGEPDRVRLQVFRSDDVLGKPVVDLDRAWEEIEQTDEGTRFLLVTVNSNEDKDYAYILRLASVVDEAVDECGALGQIKAAPGEKVPLDLHTHEGDCTQTLCQNDGDCIGERYCLAFECHPGTVCGLCPPGAYCDAQSDQCSGACGSGATLCSHDYVCCGQVCAPACPL